MHVYVELYILNNLAMNYLVLRITRRLINRKLHVWRCILSCVLGALYAVLVLYKVWPPLNTMLFKVLLSLGMVVVAFRPERWTAYLKSYWVFMAATFLLGGAMLGIFFLSGNGLWHMGTVVITTFPLHLLLIMSVGVLSGVDLFMLYYKKRLQVQNHTAAIEFTLWDRTKRLNALVDSGNMLMGDSQKQVAIVSYNALAAMAPDVVRKHFEQGELSDDVTAYSEILQNMPGTILLPYQSLGRTGILLGVRPTRLRVRSQERWIEPADTCIAIAPDTLKLGAGIQALVPPTLLI